MQQEVDDISDGLPLFDKDKWIGKGQNFPMNLMDVPLGLIYYIDKLLIIPDEVKEEYIPSPNLSIDAFVTLKLPKLSYSLAIFKAQSCFRKETPNIETATLKTRELPPIAWLNKLKEHFPQAVLDNMTSVEDPRYPGSRVPLWWIGFWRKMHKIHEIQQGWKKAIQWVEEHVHKGGSNDTQELFREAEILLTKLRWDKHTNIPGADGVNTTTFAFAAYLSDSKMMNTDHVNMMFSHLSDRAEQDTMTDSFVVIEKLRFMNAIEKVSDAKDHDQPSQPFLRRLENKIKKKDVQALVFPVYMKKEKHWLTMRADFEEKELSYGEFCSATIRMMLILSSCHEGDSLAHEGMPPPKVAIKQVQTWLKRRFGKEFKSTGDSLAHGDQEDFTDCGILMTNTAAHDMFDDTLWTYERKAIERANWFIRLSKAHIEDVRTSVSPFVLFLNVVLFPR